MGTQFSRKLLAAGLSASLAIAISPLPAAAKAADLPLAGTASASASPPGASPSVTVGAPAASESPPVKAQAPESRLIETGEGLRIDWTRGVLTMTGLGFSPDRGTLAQRRALAQRTAVTDGTRRLHEALSRLRVSGNAFVRDLAAVDESLRNALRAKVAATPVKTVTPWPDGSVEVTLELSLWGSESLAALVAPALDLDFAVVGAPLAESPSALVLDARGTGAQPALAIALKAESGKRLYQGPVTYFHDPDALAEVAGSKPLTLKARRAIGATRADLALVLEEAERFDEARQKHPLLPVVILL